MFVQSERGKPLAEESTCFLVERDRPGFTIGRIHDKMGEWLANNADLIFQDCFIPDAYVVGEPGKGFKVLADFLPQSNGYAAATTAGIAVALHKKAIDWTKIRAHSGKLLVEKGEVLGRAALLMR